MIPKKDFTTVLKVKNIEPTQPTDRVLLISKTPGISSEIISINNTMPSLSQLLRSYLLVMAGIDSGSMNNIHKIDLSEFNIELSTGMGGFQNNEMVFKI